MYVLYYIYTPQSFIVCSPVTNCLQRLAHVGTFSYSITAASLRHGPPSWPKWLRLGQISTAQCLPLPKHTIMCIHIHV